MNNDATMVRRIIARIFSTSTCDCLICLFSILACIVFSVSTSVAEDASSKVRMPYFGIRVVDSETGLGVPLVTLSTVNGIRYDTDSAGWIAFLEPGLMDREVYFSISGPGYESRKDGFGFRGVRLMTAPGTSAVVKVRRTVIAQRMVRLTGQGIYRDSTLLGIEPSRKFPERCGEPYRRTVNLSAGVMGQDSVQAVPYRGKIFWLWGDTKRADYPLGNFRTTAAYSPMPSLMTYHQADGVPYSYFADARSPDRVREMVPSEDPGVIWLFGLLNIEDDQGRETLVAHFARRRGLAELLEHGLVRFDGALGTFQKIATFDKEEKWRFPRGNAFRATDDGRQYYYFAEPFAYTRVEADLAALINPDSYETLAYDLEKKAYRWQREQAPTTQADEQKLIASGSLRPEDARYRVVDASSGKPVQMHRASICWNEFLEKWILVGCEIDQTKKPSFLGEIWYAQADRPTGPWHKAIKIASHPGYSFYNPRHHTFFDEDGGRRIYFEGTYTKMFSGNQRPTPRYDYNQILYRLDLADPRLDVLNKSDP